MDRDCNVGQYRSRWACESSPHRGSSEVCGHGRLCMRSCPVSKNSWWTSINTHMGKVGPSISHGSLSPPNNLGNYVHSMGEETEAKWDQPLFQHHTAYQGGVGNSSLASPISAFNHCCLPFIWSEASQSHVFFYSLLPHMQSCHSLRAILPWAWPRLIWASSGHIFYGSLCPLGNHGFHPESPGRAFRRHAFSSQLSLRGVCGSQRETAWLWQPEVSGSGKGEG